MPRHQTSLNIMNMRTPPALIEEEDKEEVNNNTGGGNEVDFSEYLWMADVELDDFDRQFEEELLEEAFIEACFEEMLAEEEAAQWCLFNQNGSEVSGTDISTVEDAFKTLEIIDTSKPKEEVVINSKLNPEAPEFVPRYLKL
ncbi:polyadenylate-binding protein-interacting protein 2-like isoform X1 [Haliotis asinina]|uniref:polyadenylate-binding protein-interacting protein 2-like isoform X1 n=2 Tax=Haliotis asinina TaxID=109174 RepID=UPI0035326452